MTFSSSSLESPHPHTSGESISEAVLDASSARDALPEEYRTRFDELRNGILAFCKEFQIPSEALKSKETFGTYLNSPKIPQKRMAEVVLLFQRLEHLIAHKEPLKESEQPLEYAERLYNLKEQYTAQVDLLKKTGFLDEMEQYYPAPTLEEVAGRLYERRELLETKQDQGFTRLLLVPFAMKLGGFTFRLGEFLREYKETHPDFELDEVLPFQAQDGMLVGVDNAPPSIFVYHPKSFESEHHGGRTKLDICREQFDHPGTATVGWRILLLQAPHDNTPGFRNIPRGDCGKTQGEKNLRPDVGGGSYPNEYLDILQEDQKDPKAPYYGESGMTPEDWIIAFMTHLEATGEPLDNGINKKDNSVAILTGAFFPSRKKVIQMYWHRLDKRVKMIAADPYVSRNTNVGTRFVVEI